MSQLFKSREDFRAQIQEYKKEELVFLNEKANLKSFMLDNGWKQKETLRKDFEVFVRKGEEVAIKFDSRGQRWTWRETDLDESVTKQPYMLGKLMIQNDHRTNPLTPYQEDDLVRDLLRENVAKRGIDIRDNFKGYSDIIDWLELKGARFPMAKNTVHMEPKRTEIVSAPPTPEVEQTQGKPNVSRLTEILLNETSLFKLAYELGYRAKKFESNSKIPQEVVFDVKRKSNIVEVAKAFLDGVEKVGETLYQAFNPNNGGKYKSVLIDEATNRFEDKSVSIDGDAVVMLVSIKGMKFDDAVKGIADMLRIEVPENKQESKNTYFIKGDNVLLIQRNEETGRYYFVDYEKNTKGTAFDLVKLEMTDKKGNAPANKIVYDNLVAYASKVLDEDKKAELLESYKVLSKEEVAVSMPKATSHQKAQAEEEAMSIVR